MTPINILLVDDKEENIVALEALIKRDDIRIFSTTSPNEALKIAWENHICIALVDVQMPEIDGFELVRMLKTNPRTKDILIIFVTAISFESKYAIKGYTSGAIDYLYKPLDPYITSAKVNSFIQIARNQEEIKRKNQELQNYALMIKNSTDIICSINAQNLLIQTINPAVENILGFKPEELLNKSIIDYVVNEDKPAFYKKLDEIIKTGLNFSVFEFRFGTSEKAMVWIECRASYQNKSIFINMSDVSPQKNYLEQLTKAKEVAEQGKKVKEIFLANMSHELRNPINGIMGVTQLLRKTTLTYQQNGLINLLETSSQSLLGVINDILDISKIEAGKFNIVRSDNSLHETINSVYKLFKLTADEKQIELILDIDQGIPEYLRFDSLRLNQILMNLLSNAIKFTDSGFVKLKVSVLNRLDDKVKLQFTVEDTGIGVAPEKLARIFESFEQADDDTANKYGGTGLGLAIVKKLAELKGGELTFSSETGKGSIFNFINWYTIADKPRKKIANKNNDSKLLPFKNVNVLLAEDNLINQFLLSKMLKDWDVHVEIVDNGRKLLDKLQQQDFSLILMDTHMPEMNGYQAAKVIRTELKEPKRSIPIISLSAAVLDHEQGLAIAAGMNDVLSKPFQPYELYEKIERLLKLKTV